MVCDERDEDLVRTPGLTLVIIGPLRKVHSLAR
jgi:hypothetical protein